MPSRFPGLDRISEHIYTDGEMFFDDSILPLEIFVGGSCLNNGQPNARAGYGVYCPDDQSLNYAARLWGEQTHLRAEIMAVVCAVEGAVSVGYENLVIYSDSAYVVRVINKDSRVWDDADGGSGARNFDLFEALERAKVEVECVVVKIAREENEQADRIARHAANQEESYAKVVKLVGPNQRDLVVLG